MGEPFDAIGFKVIDQASYQALAEEAHQRGALSFAQRSQGLIHGCCWRLGAGLEVWTMLYESQGALFYADCRPAFRGRALFTFHPWEIIEYEENGQAWARGTDTDSKVEMVFELQNLTELNADSFRQPSIKAAVSGLAYRARINKRVSKPVFDPLLIRAPRRDVAENDYLLRGKILSWREITNPHTTSGLVLVEVDAGKFKLEVVVNRNELKGELKLGAWLSAEIWLQGHLVTEKELRSRYEGKDLRMPTGAFWKSLRREN